MRTRPVRLLALSLLLPAWLAAASAPPASDPLGDGWSPVRSAEGAGYAYRVFSKENEGENFIRYRVQGTIRAKAEVLPASVRVIVGDPEWVPEGQSRRVLVDEPDEFIVHTLIDLPPLFSDRDVVSRGLRSFDAGSGTHRVDWVAVEHEQAPVIPGVIRIQRASGSWVFTQLDEQSTHVDYETYIDLGGSLPGWLIQPLMAGNVAKNFEDLAHHAIRRQSAAAPTSVRAP